MQPMFKPVGNELVSCSSQKNKNYYPALRLHFGDRVNLHQLTFGQATYNYISVFDIRPPIDLALTFVLRTIGDDGALADEEEIFLHAIQSVARAENYGDTNGSDGATTMAIAEKFSDPDVRRSLWNKMPDALRLVNVEQYDENKKDRTRWQLTINMKALCSVFPDRNLFEKAYGSIAAVCEDDVFRPIDFGQRGFRHPAYAAAFFESGEAESRTYYDTIPVSGTFSFVAVEARGASMRTPGSPEQNWSLKEWQAAGICRFDSIPSEVAVIRRLKLKGVGLVDWIRIIYGDVAKPLVTHKVQIANNLPTDQSGPRRHLTKVRGGYPYRIDADDLDKLHLSDITEIEWGREPDDGAWLARKWSESITSQCEL
ncbi:hypothetical protein GCM10027181_22020 [Rheinheimera gaetbuli]